MPKTAIQKPQKPNPEFPLTPHDRGQWVKKINGKLYYFGSWEDPQGALEEYLKNRDELQAGRDPRREIRTSTVSDVCNSYLLSEKRKAEQGDIKFRTWRERKDIADKVVKILGRNAIVDTLSPADWGRLRTKLADGIAPITLKNWLTRVRGIFSWAYENECIERPPRYGSEFKPPAKRRLREARNAAPKKMFQAEEIRKLIAAAPQPLKPMILLAINGGMGNHDVAMLKLHHIDGSGWLDYPRPKTQTPRRFPLWPETIKAIDEAIALRPRSKLDYLFLTRFGNPWAWERMEKREAAGADGSDMDVVTSDSVVVKEFIKLLKRLEMHNRGRGFYALRHTFRTVADETLDFPAIELVMGHAGDPRDMGHHYRERISDERLNAVVDHVHRWLFPPAMGWPRTGEKQKRPANGSRK